MENCKLLHENVFAYVEKDLPPALLLQLDAHMHECTKCAALVAEFKSAMVFDGRTEVGEPRPFAETRLLQELKPGLEKRQKYTTPVFVRILQPAMVSIGVAVALTIGFFIGSDFAVSHSQYSQNEK